jgi:LysR family transcriptional activator of dmlA
MGAGRHGIILRSEWDVAEDLQQGRLLPLLPDLFQQADVWWYTRAFFCLGQGAGVHWLLQQWFATAQLR